jgi:hypothetical protein
MERRQSSTGQVDRKESGIDQGESRPSSSEKVERREETASADRMERRNDTVWSCRHGGGDTALYWSGGEETVHYWSGEQDEVL